MRLLIITLFVFGGFKVFAQETTLKGAFSKGKTSGYIRSFFMATDNSGELKDWNALALGGKLKYNTARYKGFSFGLAYYSSFNLGISDITEVDPSTGKESRYEAGLFDVNDLSKTEINLLGELYLNYKFRQHLLTVGRFKIKTPFLNPEDGRMIPTLQSGIWYHYLSPKKRTTFDVMWITHIAARSTSEFMTTAKSIGSYPQGKNPDGSNSNYKQNLSSAGLGVLAFNHKHERYGIKVYDFLLDNIFNSAFIEPSYKLINGKHSHTISGQYLVQSKINQGGNPDPSKTYIHDDLSQVIGLQYKVKKGKLWSFSGNWNYVTNDGRFVFPREWGREFFFVFQKRERLEGVSNTHAWMVDVNRNFNLKKAGLLNVTLGYGQYYRPEANDFEVNKYAIPANDQLNLDVFWFLQPDKKGVVVEFLLTHKRALGDTYNNPNFILNKVNMTNYNVVVNYIF